MTDREWVAKVIAALDPSTESLAHVPRGKGSVLALPAGKSAAGRALRLYQPQRALARAVAALLGFLSKLGLHGLVLPRQPLHISPPPMFSPPLPEISPGSCGILLGSPDHEVRRAIVSFESCHAWEVAKVAAGADGAAVLESEAQALDQIHGLVRGVPRLLGLHRGAELSILRMPYVTGRPVPHGDCTGALRLLDSWVRDVRPAPARDFPEWPSIQRALGRHDPAGCLDGRLSGIALTPVVRHGDFARWNLLCLADGSLTALDWEWGHPAGMPGIDLVHYFLQDWRLVRRLSPEASVQATLADLRRPACRDYLARTGWGDATLLPIVACLAFKHGAGHQDNAAVLDAVLEMARQSGAAA